MKGILAAAAAALLLPAAAGAQDWRARDTMSIRVDASALDLSTASGVDELERRVRRAVDRICGSDRECREEAWASTDDQVDYAIARDEWTRRLAAERAAELEACGGYGCPPSRPAYYAPPPPPPPIAPAGVTVIIYTAGSPAIHYGPPPGWR